MKPIRSHWIPRTRAGRLVVGAFLLVFAFTQPPLVYWIGNRVDPWIGGVPFLYAYLLVLYILLIGILIAGARRGL